MFSHTLKRFNRFSKPGFIKEMLGYNEDSNCVKNAFSYFTIVFIS